MRIRNAKIFDGEAFFLGSVETKGDRILRVTEADLSGTEAFDAGGRYLIPGLIDLHFHGCRGDDFCDNDIEAIERIARYEASEGITAMAPATMTYPVEELCAILKTAAGYKNTCQDKRGADLVGINMEGPFISPVKKGAQDARNIKPADLSDAQRFVAASEGLVRFIGLAPEESPDFEAFIRAISQETQVTLAHTNADYETARRAFQAGATHVTHLYNAMPPFHHRQPGVIGAAAENDTVMPELICDGIHIHPSVVRGTFRLFGDDRVILISDSMRATGMPDGVYTLGGLDVEVRGRLATLKEGGAIAGSATNLMDCVRTAVNAMDIPLTSAIKAATVNPAKSLGIQKDYGAIKEGKKAHMVLLEEDLALYRVIKDGAFL